MAPGCGIIGMLGLTLNLDGVCPYDHCCVLDPFKTRKNSSGFHEQDGHYFPLAHIPPSFSIFPSKCHSCFLPLSFLPDFAPLSSFFPNCSPLIRVHHCPSFSLFTPPRIPFSATSLIWHSGIPSLLFSFLPWQSACIWSPPSCTLSDPCSMCTSSLTAHARWDRRRGRPAAQSDCSSIICLTGKLVGRFETRYFTW